MRDVVRSERNEADRALGGDRAKALDDAPRRQAEAALAQQFEGHKIAFDSLAAHALGDEDLARRAALLHGEDAAGAIFQFAIDAERARTRLIENLDDATAVSGLLCSRGRIEFDPHQHPRAEARRWGAPAPN